MGEGTSPRRAFNTSTHWRSTNSSRTPRSSVHPCNPAQGPGPASGGLGRRAGLATAPNQRRHGSPRRGRFDITLYGESLFSDPSTAARDFKPVTHGQARFTKFLVVDKFGQVVTSIPERGQRLYPCLSPSLACDVNVAEGDGLANAVELDLTADGRCQFFQLGHRINQDARMNVNFVVNSADVDSHSPTTKWFKGDPGVDGSDAEHLWRPIAEYENPVWGWLVIDYRDRGIQVYHPDGQIMAEALLPSTVDGKVFWQAGYGHDIASALTPAAPGESRSQLMQFLGRLHDPKFLSGLWSMLSEACQYILHALTAFDSQLLNLVGRPMALVNLSLSLELATPPMQTQSYHDLLKPAEMTLEEYKFEVLMGDKENLADGLVGYFPISPQPPSPPAAKGSDPNTPGPGSDSGSGSGSGTGASPHPAPVPGPELECIYTKFGYPERQAEDAARKHNTFARPTEHPVYLSPFWVNPVDYPTPEAYTRALANHTSAAVVGAIVDPFHGVHFTTGVLPPATLGLPAWVVDRALKQMGICFRGGPLLLQGDLPPPVKQMPAPIPPITDNGDWTWLQPVRVDTDAPDAVPAAVAYDVRPVVADYPIMPGPHTCVEGFYRFGRSSGKPTHGGDDATLRAPELDPSLSFFPGDPPRPPVRAAL